LQIKSEGKNSPYFLSTSWPSSAEDRSVSVCSYRIPALMTVLESGSIFIEEYMARIFSTSTALLLNSGFLTQEKFCLDSCTTSLVSLEKVPLMPYSRTEDSPKLME